MRPFMRLACTADFVRQRAFGAGNVAKNMMSPALALILFVLVAGFIGMFLGRHLGLSGLGDMDFAYLAVFFIVIIFAGAFIASLVFGKKGR